MLLISCQTTKITEQPPLFPELDTYTRDVENGTITVSDYYIIQLAEFAIKYKLFLEVYYDQ